MKIKKLISIISCIAVGLSLTACSASPEKLPTNKYLNSKAVEDDILLAKVGNKKITKKDLMLQLDINLVDVEIKKDLTKAELLELIDRIVVNEAAYQKAIEEKFLEKNEGVDGMVNAMAESSVKYMYVLSFINSTAKEYNRIIKVYDLEQGDLIEQARQTGTAYSYMGASLDLQDSRDVLEVMKEQGDNLKKEFNVVIYEDQIEKLLK